MGQAKRRGTLEQRRRDARAREAARSRELTGRVLDEELPAPKDPLARWQRRFDGPNLDARTRLRLAARDLEHLARVRVRVAAKRQRALVALRAEGLSWEELASLAGVSVRTVRGLVDPGGGDD